MDKFDSSVYLINIVNYLKLNLVGIMFLGMFSLLISYFSFKDYITSIITIVIVTLVTWLGHYFTHCNIKYNILYDIHQKTHHSPFADTLLGKLIEYLIIETIFFGGGILLLLVMLIKKLYNVYILNPYVILYWTISVPIVHELYYHILNVSDFHKLHHQNQNFGYSSDYWDTVFKTKENNSEFENETKIMPIHFIICLLVVAGINTKFDFINQFS